MASVYILIYINNEPVNVYNEFLPQGYLFKYTVYDYPPYSSVIIREAHL